MHWRILRGLLLKIIYPLLMIAGAFGGRERLQGWVIKQNNRLVRLERPTIERILVLLPHCLQVDACDIRLTHDIRKCKRCGRCRIRDLIAVSEEFGLSLHVATGGTLARRIVKEARPDGIVAVACERDLSSGIADTYPLPVLGVWNERPEGPCLNTQVNIENVRQAIRQFGLSPRPRESEEKDGHLVDCREDGLN